MTICSNCGAEAGPEKWRTLCRRCFRVQKFREDQQLENECDRLRDEVSGLRKLLRAAANLPSARGAAVPPDKVAALIRLCHPDKHNGSRAATEMTQWLLTLKRK